MTDSTTISNSRPLQTPVMLHSWHLPLFSALWGVSWCPPAPLTPAFCCSTVSERTLPEASQQGEHLFFPQVECTQYSKHPLSSSHRDEQKDTNHCADERKGERRTHDLCFSNDEKEQQRNKGRRTSWDQLHAGLLCALKVHRGSSSRSRAWRDFQICPSKRSLIQEEKRFWGDKGS